MKLYHVVGITVMVGLAGCVSNHYKITTVYQNPSESTTITSEIEGKNTIGKVAYIYKQVLTFVDLEYTKKK